MYVEYRPIIQYIVTLFTVRTSYMYDILYINMFFCFKIKFFRIKMNAI